MLSKVPHLILTRPSRGPKHLRDRQALSFGADQHGRPAIWITCHRCKIAQGVAVSYDLPALAIDQHFGEARGWLVEGHGRKGTCPKCRKEKAQEAAGPSPAQIHATFKALEAHLRVDGDVGEFVPGWSDARVAEQVGVAESAVAELRRGNFAPRLADRAREELRREVGEFEAMAHRELTSLRALLEDASQTLLVQVAELRRRLDP